VVRYPALGAPSNMDVRGTRPATAAGPFPLVVLAHGYRLAPYTYTQLLRTWARAGYVVASQRRDPRIRAAIGFSGAEIAAFIGFPRPTRSIPVLAVQGTADSVNSPSGTYAYFAAAPRPKYLLRLLGGEHTSPYQDAQPYLAVVERVSTAFLDLYLKNQRAASRQLATGGNVPGRATLQSDP
jgi:fermentation-respiration switch protein FrsA (DUF1100 family)